MAMVRSHDRFYLVLFFALNFIFWFYLLLFLGGWHRGQPANLCHRNTVGTVALGKAAATKESRKWGMIRHAAGVRGHGRLICGSPPGWLRLARGFSPASLGNDLSKRSWGDFSREKEKVSVPQYRYFFAISQ
jgi:hypothetical protein